MPFRIILSLTLLAAAPVLAQNTDTVTHTTADLQQRETKLMETAKATPTGVAIDTFDDFGAYHTLLVVRAHTGEAEQHQLWADQMIVRKGTITLVTGGTMQGEHPVPNQPGETRGTGIEGGKEVTLHAGEIAHIPAGVPHWVKMAPGTSTTILVIKEKLEK